MEVAVRVLSVRYVGYLLKYYMKESNGEETIGVADVPGVVRVLRWLEVCPRLRLYMTWMIDAVVEQKPQVQ